MEINCWTGPLKECACDWLVLGLPENGSLPAAVAEIDEALKGSLVRRRDSGDLESGLGDLTVIADLPDLAAGRLLIVGLGTANRLTTALLDKALKTAGRVICRRAEQTVAVAGWEAWASGGKVNAARIPEQIAMAFTLAAQGTGHYRQKVERHPLVSLTLSGSPGSDPLPAAERGRIVGESMNLCRELVNRAPNDIYPESFAERAREVAAVSGLHVEILDEHRLAAERMGSLLGVAQGSEQPPRLVILKHEGAGPDAPTLALCGKGVTFDSGGLSLKSNENMLTMKCDMAGAATVAATLSAIGRLKLPVNVIGLMGLVENMPSGTAFKLGDVLTARNGTTIEIHNTDAEGRLVLADVLAYAADLGVDRMIDLATLTGACVVALGMEITGVFANCTQLSDAVLAAARAVGEEAWPLPMSEFFSEQLKSDVADVKNVGSRWGGAITAAKFLEKFVGDTSWVHLDIAGPSFASSSRADRDAGATGCMVRTLVELVSSGSESAD